ncbi:putative MFS family arabinose efflux permease [Allofrancisella inopinata]|uniref:Tetracycline resistance protein n=1 Tax=Allofrancisella inopinata TaxID=1085647 RepID=A0AAE6YH81_9GAMM|nr:MFS transporter [Allofrancisella inopinata]QIV95377.1 MFS transporter [Allofrancisella inopinata]TDT70406.1 putative MFS family arabinose efflux permease [Allofrancisella inopinata]
MKQYKIIVLLSYISIASASAVIINPALPHISKELGLATGQVEWLVSIFLVGYVIGQIIYGPIANRYGEVKALRFGLVLNLLGILLCLAGGYVFSMKVLLIGRFITALGSSAGLVCTFIILNNSVEPAKARLALSYATISFALALSLAILIGGLVDSYLHWRDCFFVLLVHGLIMFGLSFMYTDSEIQRKALNINNILRGYINALCNFKLIAFSLVIGVMSVFSYCYSAAGPFITHDLFGFSSAEYGVWNSLTMVGIIGGSIAVARVINKYNDLAILGVALVAMAGFLGFLSFMYLENLLTPVIFFVIATLMYFTCSFIYPTASHIASNALKDKANASGAMNFVNMGTAVIAVSVMGYLPFDYIWKFVLTCVVLPIVCLFLLSLVKLKD